MSKSPTTIKYKEGDKLPPIHPGEILRSEFMEPLKLSATKLAIHMGIPLSRVSAILNGSRGITADTAVRLARVFNTSSELWVNLQSNYEIASLDYSGEMDKIFKAVRRLA